MLVVPKGLPECVINGYFYNLIDIGRGTPYCQAPVHVTYGAQWLDKQQPGWERKIDLSKLDIHLCNHCILGQLGGFDNLSTLIRKQFITIPLFAAPVHLGFTTNQDRQAWIDLIKLRFDTGTLSDSP